MEMPKVLSCSMKECAYNMEKQCHALAINVGAEHPACDTFTNSSARAGVPESLAGIGACKVSNCRYNRSLECSAPGITVGHHEKHADCKTFVPA